MELTKHAQACVTLDKGDGHLLVDPGTFSLNAAELIARASTILITHEHFDHFDEAAIAAALEARPRTEGLRPLRCGQPLAGPGRARSRRSATATSMPPSTRTYRRWRTSAPLSTGASTTRVTPTTFPPCW